MIWLLIYYLLSGEFDFVRTECSLIKIVKWPEVLPSAVLTNNRDQNKMSKLKIIKKQNKYDWSENVG